MFKIRRLKPEEYGLATYLDNLIFRYEPSVDVKRGAWWAAFDEEGYVVAFAGIHPSMQMKKAGYLCRVGVVEKARGHGLQKRLIRTRERYAREQGWTEMRTDTSADNIASMHSLIRCGYKPFIPTCIEWGVDGAVYWRKEL